MLTFLLAPPALPWLSRPLGSLHPPARVLNLRITDSSKNLIKALDHQRPTTHMCVHTRAHMQVCVLFRGFTDSPRPVHGPRTPGGCLRSATIWGRIPGAWLQARQELLGAHPPATQQLGVPKPS